MEKLPIVIRRKMAEKKKLKSINILGSRIELETYEKLQKSRYFCDFFTIS